jgi:putative chitinase
MISVLRSNVLIVSLGILILLVPTKSLSDGALLTVEDVLKISPSARQEYAEALSNASEQFEAAGINTRLRMANFVAQVMTETGG